MAGGPGDDADGFLFFTHYSTTLCSSRPVHVVRAARAVNACGSAAEAALSPQLPPALVQSRNSARNQTLMKSVFLDCNDQLAPVWKRVVRPDDPAIDVNRKAFARDELPRIIG